MVKKIKIHFIPLTFVSYQIYIKYHCNFDHEKQSNFIFI